MAAELTVEAVRDFIVLNDGKVKNNILVTHFRKFLNDPGKKSEARQKFKDCVNTVAVVKTENGEKYVQLKKKYRSGLPIKIPDDENVEPLSPDRMSPTQHHMVSSFDVPNVPESEQERRYSGVSSSSESASYPPTPPKHAPIGENQKSESVPSQVDPTISVPAEQKRRPKRSSAESTPTHRPPPAPHMDPSGNFKVPFPPGAERRSGSDVTPKRVSNTGSAGSGSVDYRSSQTGSLGSLDPGRSNFGSSNDDSASIMQSEASLDSNQNADFDDDRGPSTFVMDPIEKQWMLNCARGDMFELRKLLNNDPNLVEKKDFVFGYTALHWAAKKGNEDLVRMFADVGAEVNVMSNGGYTPMHLAAMHGHEKIVQILVEEYEADPRIRNYSGKLAKDYLKSSISLPMQTLLFGAGNDGTTNLRDFAAGLRPRLDTVRKSKRLGNAISGGVGVLGALVRGKAVSNEDVSSISSSSPHIVRKGSFNSKGKKKKNRKFSKDERSTASLMSTPDDFEYGFGPRSSINDPIRHGNAPSPVMSSKNRNRGDSVISRGYGDDNGGFR